MEENLNFLEMEDDLNLFENGRQHHFFLMEDDLNVFGKWNTTSIFFKWKTTSVFFVIFCLNGRRPQFFVNKIIMQPETFKIETMVVAPLRVTLF